MSNPRDSIVATVAEIECRRLARGVMRYLRRLTDVMLSGDGGILENTWEEVCVQVQWEYSPLWPLYEEAMRGWLSPALDDVAVHLKQAIWLQTESAEQWERDEPNNAHFSPDDEVLVEHIITYVIREADTYTNRRIARFLELWGAQ